MGLYVGRQPLPANNGPPIQYMVEYHVKASKYEYVQMVLFHHSGKRGKSKAWQQLLEM